MATEIKGPFERSQMINRLREQFGPDNRVSEVKVGIVLLLHDVTDYAGEELKVALKARAWLEGTVTNIALIKYKSK